MEEPYQIEPYPEETKRNREARIPEVDNTGRETRGTEITKQVKTTEFPWLDIRLSEEAIKYLWSIINNKQTKKDMRKNLAGNISKSLELHDNKDNWFYKTILNPCSETLYFREWSNYYEVHISKMMPPPIFKLKELWVNYQKQHEFNPPHNHGGSFSFVVFMKIPTDWREQHALPICAKTNTPSASNFQFLLGTGMGPVQPIYIPLSPEDEGRMLFFPSWLFHEVFPFYGTEEERITVSGNIDLLLKVVSTQGLNE